MIYIYISLRFSVLASWAVFEGKRLVVNSLLHRQPTLGQHRMGGDVVRLLTSGHSPCCSVLNWMRSL